MDPFPPLQHQTATKTATSTNTNTARKLCYSRRRRSVRRKANKILPKLEKDNILSLALKDIEGVLSTTVCEISCTLTNNNSTHGQPRSSENGSGGGEIYASEDHRAVCELPPIETISIKVFHITGYNQFWIAGN